MKKLLLCSSMFVLLAFPVEAGNMQHLGCNTAIQNWVNGSGTTCPPLGAGTSKVHRVRPAPAPKVTPPDDDDDGGVDDPGDDDDGGVDDPGDDDNDGGVDDPGDDDGGVDDPGDDDNDDGPGDDNEDNEGPY